MARGTRIGIGLWVLAAAALAVSLIQPGEPEPEGWFSYVPLDVDSLPPADLDGPAALDPALWLGIAIGLAFAGAVVLLVGRRVGSGRSNGGH